MHILVNRARNAISCYITNLKQHIIAKFVVSREFGKFWDFSVPSIILADLLGKIVIKLARAFKNDEHKSWLLSLNNDRTPKEQQVTAVLLLAEKIEKMSLAYTATNTVIILSPYGALQKYWNK